MLSIDRTTGYFDDINNNKELHLKVIKSFPKHDPAMNFMILKLFWEQGFVKGDCHFEKVMKLNTEEYMKKLQKNYRFGNSLGNNFKNEKS